MNKIHIKVGDKNYYLDYDAYIQLMEWRKKAEDAFHKRFIEVMEEIDRKYEANINRKF